MQQLSEEEIARRKRLNRKLWPVVIVLFAILFGLIGFMNAISPDDEDMPGNTTVTYVPKTKWDIWIEQQTSAWDGSCRPVEQLIKKQLNDPGSYEHVETRYRPNADTSAFTVYTQFRAKNGFGALMLTAYQAEVSYNGTVLSLEEMN